MKWSAGVGESGLALAIALGSGCPCGIETQAKRQYQPTGYYDQAPAMKWDLAVSWGRGVRVSFSDSVRVGLANRIEKQAKGFRDQRNYQRNYSPTRWKPYLLRTVISACWILKWRVSTANRSAFFVVLICRQVLNFCTCRTMYADRINNYNDGEVVDAIDKFSGEVVSSH